MANYSVSRIIIIKSRTQEPEIPSNFKQSSEVSVYVSDVWKTVNTIYVYQNGAWKTVNYLFVYKN